MAFVSISDDALSIYAYVLLLDFICEFVVNMCGFGFLSGYF